MTLSKFNQTWFDLGRSARLKAQLTAYKTKQPVQLPLSSYNPTAAAHWRDGWNSVSLEDIQNYCKPNSASNSNVTPINDPIANARKVIKGTQ
jgi:hypothetical protein